MHEDAFGCEVEVRLAGVLADDRRIFEASDLVHRSTSFRIAVGSTGPPTTVDPSFLEQYRQQGLEELADDAARDPDLAFHALHVGLQREGIEISARQLSALARSSVIHR